MGNFKMGSKLVRGRLWLFSCYNNYHIVEIIIGMNYCQRTILFASEVYKLFTSHFEMLRPFANGRKWLQLRPLEF